MDSTKIMPEEIRSLSQKQAFRTHRVVKRNKKLVVICFETGDVVYTPPDFLRKKMVNRDRLEHLADRLNIEWLNPIEAIMEFESSFDS